METLLFLHVDHQFFFRARQFDHQRDDDRHQCHVGISRYGDGAEQMGSQFDGGEDGRRAVRAADDAERGCFLWGEAHQDGRQEDGKNAELGRRAEDGQPQVAQHGAEVGQCPHAHEDDGREEARLDEHVVQEGHEAEFMGNVVQGHFPDVGFRHAVGQGDEALRVGLDHAHLSSREVGQQYAERDGHE